MHINGKTTSNSCTLRFVYYSSETGLVNEHQEAELEVKEYVNNYQELPWIHAKCGEIQHNWVQHSELWQQKWIQWKLSSIKPNHDTTYKASNIVHENWKARMGHIIRASYRSNANYDLHWAAMWCIPSSRRSLMYHKAKPSPYRSPPWPCTLKCTWSSQFRDWQGLDRQNHFNQFSWY